MSHLNRKPPKVTGKDAERFKLKAEINDKKMELKLLRIKAMPLNTAIFNLEREIYNLEEDLKDLNNDENSVDKV